MIRKILTYPMDKDVLSQKSEKVDNVQNEEIQKIIQDLKDTLHSDESAKGLSAIQLGYPKQICICGWAGKEIVMINPEITRTRGEQEFLEGCLSVPNFFVKIKRAQKVWCKYLDENGVTKEIAEGGRMSNIIQHELDHFEGQCKVHEMVPEELWQKQK